MEIERSSQDEIASRPATSTADAPCTAESAECTCPDFCERDHEQTSRQRRCLWTVMLQKQYSSAAPEARRCSLSTMWLWPPTNDRIGSGRFQDG